MIPRLLTVSLFLVLLPISARGQAVTQTCPVDAEVFITAFSSLVDDLPAKKETEPLLNKANEKISDFERALRTFRVDLETADPGTTQKLLDASASGHEILAKMLADGYTTIGLFAIMATLDDLSRDASREALSLLVTGGRTEATMAEVSALVSAGTALHDISELIFHTT